MLNYKYG